MTWLSRRAGVTASSCSPPEPKPAPPTPPKPWEGGQAVNPIGIFAKTFPRPTPEANLDAVRSHGLGVVQYNLACAGLLSMPERIEPRLARQIAAAAASRRIAIAAVSGTFNMIDPVRERRDAGMRR